MPGFVPPKAAQNNAKRALKMREKQPPSNRGMTPVGLARARDLANGKSLSLETVKRMAAFRRHQKNYKPGEPTKGTQAWLGWGGEAGVRWAERVVERERKKKEK
jgi:hypothetical protein